MADESDLNNLKTTDFEALRKANPEAYGDKPVEPDAAAQAEAEAATKAAADAEAAKADDLEADATVVAEVPVVADLTKAPPILIPKARLDEVLADSRTKDATLSEQAAKIAELEAKLNPPVVRDFDAEHLELQNKYDNGDLEREDFLKEQRKLQKEEIVVTAAAIADDRIAKRDQVMATQSAEQAFASADAAWSTANAELLGKDGAKEAMQTALSVVDQQHAYKLSPADLFEKAGKVAAAMLGLPVAGAVATLAADPHAARNAADARAQALASGTPAPLQGGMGDRSAANVVDITTMKQGDFGKLSKADQDKALGLTA